MFRLVQSLSSGNAVSGAVLIIVFGLILLNMRNPLNDRSHRELCMIYHYAVTERPSRNDLHKVLVKKQNLQSLTKQSTENREVFRSDSGPLIGFASTWVLTLNYNSEGCVQTAEVMCSDITTTPRMFSQYLSKVLAEENEH